MTRRFHWLVLAGLVAVPFSLVAPPSQACSGGMAAKGTAFPATGAVDVSPETSIVLVSSGAALPAGLSLLANGVAVPLPSITFMGPGLTATGFGSFFKLQGPLEPSTDYTLRAASDELTHFSTAATYNKDPGVAPTINRLRLWRVHYPDNLIAAGGCVFAAYEGYFALDFTPASLPGTPADQMVSVLSLSSRETGTNQQFVFVGIDAVPGGLVDAAGSNAVPLPEGGALSPSAALWKPTLEVGRTYCATLSVFGRNDVAALPVQSNSVCAIVTGVDSPALAAAGGAGGGAGDGPDASGLTGTKSGGGCRVAAGAGDAPASGALALGMAGGLVVAMATRRRRSNPRSD